MESIKVAMIGVGAISGIYLENITNLFSEIELIGVCDLIREKAEKAKEAYQVPKLYEDMHEAFADPEVDIVLNLTRPYEHYEVSKAALEAGKHVYSEKPLGASLQEGRSLVELAEKKGLWLGGAPDTCLGAGIQTCRKLIDDNVIGDVIGVTAAMIGHGPESWHPDPAFFYRYGGGPMMDMGPYYITALVNLMGAVKGVTAVARSSFPQRTITSKPFRGEVVDVEVPTYVTGILDFASGATGTLLTTFDVYYKNSSCFEIYGSLGTLIVPDPNFFGGPIRLLRPEEGAYQEIPLMFDYKENSRGLGLADAAKAIQTGRESRVDYHQTLHVLEILTAFEKSSKQQSYLPIDSQYTRKRPMCNNTLTGILD